MNKHATVLLLLTVAVATPAWADECMCDGSKTPKSTMVCDGSKTSIPTMVFGSTRCNPALGVPGEEIFSMNADGTNVRRLTCPTNAQRIDANFGGALSRDGKGRIVFDSNRNRAPGEPLNTSDLWLMKQDGTWETLLTRGSSATWSPNGKRIAFHRSASGTGLPVKIDPGAPTTDSVIFVAKVRDLLKGKPPKQITRPPDGQIDDDADWSPDGKWIVFTRKNRDDPDPNNPTSAEIYVIDAKGKGEPVRLTTNDFEERSPAWSPDGTRIVYSCRIGMLGSNGLEICVMNYPPDGSKPTQLTNNNLADLGPHWSPDGRKISFQRPAGVPVRQQIWVMDLEQLDQNGFPVATQFTQNPPDNPMALNFAPDWGVICPKDEDDEDSDN